MEDLHAIADSLIAYLVGMTFVEVILKPLLLVRNGHEVDPRGRPGLFFAGLGDTGSLTRGFGAGRAD